MIEIQDSAFDKISPTALMVAYARQFTDIPYGKDLSELVNAQLIVENLVEDTSEIPVEMAVLIEGRYKAINQVMKQFGTTQILELASGLLPRGMAMSQDATITYIESDLPAMISRKQRIVNQLVGERPNLNFVAIDAASQPSEFTRLARYLDPQKPVTVLCEGLLMYLSFE